MIIDTHTHIYLNKKNTEKDIIFQLKNDNISNIISIGIDLETSKKSIELANNYPGIIYATVGIHPTYVLKYKDNLEETINKLERMIIENKKFIKGIGECGFDFFYTKKETKLQEIFFSSQILLAKKYDFPVVIHSRNSKEDILKVLKKYDCKKFILHCYSEDLEFAYKIINYSQECKISFSGIVTYKSAKNVQDVASNIPLDKILVETDCPFLSPQEVRGSENIPNNVKYNLKKIFELRQKNGKQETQEEFERQIFYNSKEIFNI